MPFSKAQVYSQPCRIQIGQISFPRPYSHHPCSVLSSPLPFTVIPIAVISASLLQSFPPTFTVIHAQAGISDPNWCYPCDRFQM